MFLNKLVKEVGGTAVSIPAMRRLPRHLRRLCFVMKSWYNFKGNMRWGPPKKPKLALIWFWFDVCIYSMYTLIAALTRDKSNSQGFDHFCSQQFMQFSFFRYWSLFFFLSVYIYLGFHSALGMPIKIKIKLSN